MNADRARFQSRLRALRSAAWANHLSHKLCTGQLLSPFGATDQPGFGPSTSTAFGAAALGPFSFGSNQDLQGVTRASELLGNPSLATGFTAKVCPLLLCFK